MKIINNNLLDKVSAQAKESPRLRMNYNFHQSLEDKCHRFLNAVEPGTKVEIHRHPTKDESFVLLRGRVRVNTYKDDGTVIESVVLCPEEDSMGWTFPRMSVIMWNVWSLGVYSLNVKKVRLCLMRKKAFCAFNDNANLNANLWI